MKNIGFLCPYTPKIHPKIYPKYLKFLYFWVYLGPISLPSHFTALYTHTPSIPIKIPKKSLGFLWHGEGIRPHYMAGKVNQLPGGPYPFPLSLPPVPHQLGPLHCAVSPGYAGRAYFLSYGPKQKLLQSLGPSISRLAVSRVPVPPYA